MAKSFADGFEIAPHHHRRDQLVYAVSGLMRVRTEHEAWIVPPDRAVYVPGSTTHSISMRGEVEMRTLYIARERRILSAAKPRRSLACLDLLRELILALIDEPMLYDRAGRGGAIVSLILSEIMRAPRLPLVIPDAAGRAAAPRVRAASSTTRPTRARSRDGRRLRAPRRARSRACSRTNCT